MFSFNSFKSIKYSLIKFMFYFRKKIIQKWLLYFEKLTVFTFVKHGLLILIITLHAVLFTIIVALLTLYLLNSFFFRKNIIQKWLLDFEKLTVFTFVKHGLLILIITLHAVLFKIIVALLTFVLPTCVISTRFMITCQQSCVCLYQGPPRTC